MRTILAAAISMNPHTFRPFASENRHFQIDQRLVAFDAGHWAFDLARRNNHCVKPENTGTSLSQNTQLDGFSYSRTSLPQLAEPVAA